MKASPCKNKTVSYIFSWTRLSLSPSSRSVTNTNHFFNFVTLSWRPAIQGPHGMPGVWGLIPKRLLHFISQSWVWGSQHSHLASELTTGAKVPRVSWVASGTHCSPGVDQENVDWPAGTQPVRHREVLKIPIFAHLCVLINPEALRTTKGSLH